MFSSLVVVCALNDWRQWRRVLDAAEEIKPRERREEHRVLLQESTVALTSTCRQPITSFQSPLDIGANYEDGSVNASSKTKAAAAMNFMRTTSYLFSFFFSFHGRPRVQPPSLINKNNKDALNIVWYHRGARISFRGAGFLMPLYLYLHSRAVVVP